MSKMWKILKIIGVIFILLPLGLLRDFAWWLEGWTPKALNKAEKWVMMWGRKSKDD